MRKMTSSKYFPSLKCSYDASDNNEKKSVQELNCFNSLKQVRQYDQSLKDEGAGKRPLVR